MMLITIRVGSSVILDSSKGICKFESTFIHHFLRLAQDAIRVEVTEFISYVHVAGSGAGKYSPLLVHEHHI